MTRTIGSTIARTVGMGFLLFTTGFASANEALYDAPPPDDAVFVRWLNTSDTPKALGLDLAPVTGIGADFGHFSAADGKGIAAGVYLSVVADADGTPRLVEEPARDAVGKVHLVLVNALDAPVRMVVAEGGPEVIGTTAPMSSGLRAVNPVSATLAVEDAQSGKTLGTADLQLQRGTDVTILVASAGVEVIEDGFGGGPLLP